MALLHSFAYDAATEGFQAVVARDPGCAIAHWGVAMSLYHELWSPPGVEELRLGGEELRLARDLGSGTERERMLIAAASAYFADAEPAHHATRAEAYVEAMEAVARRFPADDEMQVLYALALIATAPPSDRMHARQKRAAAILEPIYAREPDHPGVAHYLIHAYDSAELAPQGVMAARAYARIAPSAPHALHMPSHIFTRLGLWDDVIASNEAARRAAREQGDVGEELHAMDYLVYGYLQRGREADAERIAGELRVMGRLPSTDFKVTYAATAIPVRLAVERQQWSAAAAIAPLADAPAQVAAVAYWARALGQARQGRAADATGEISQLDACEARARAAGTGYWATQIRILADEARAWSAIAVQRPDEALERLRVAADAEDALEKLPVTPGPVVPAREQLGEMLLTLGRPREALVELTRSLRDAPRRRAGLALAIRAAEAAGDGPAAESLRRSLGR